MSPSSRRAPTPTVSDRALLLRRYPYGESSLLVHLLTPEHGRVHALAKGAYRVKSGYFGVLDLFDTLSASWRPNPRSDLALFVAGSVQRRRRGVCAGLENYRAGLALLELAAMAAREGHEERELFRLVEQALELLDAGTVDPGLVAAAFELRFLRVQGLAPALLECASCGRPAEEPGGAAAPACFSPALGGRLCPSCAAEARSRPGGPRLEQHPAHAIRIAASLSTTPLAHLARIRLDARQTERLRVFVRRFLEYHLEARPRAWGPSPGRRASLRRA